MPEACGWQSAATVAATMKRFTTVVRHFTLAVVDRTEPTLDQRTRGGLVCLSDHSVIAAACSGSVSPAKRQAKFGAVGRTEAAVGSWGSAPCRARIHRPTEVRADTSLPAASLGFTPIGTAALIQYNATVTLLLPLHALLKSGDEEGSSRGVRLSEARRRDTA
jgi:hypothetical protein